MKLHLPKSLLVAVAYVTVTSSFAAEYDVGTITGKMNLPSNSANIKTYNGSEDGTDDGIFTLSGNDWLGAKDASGNKITSFGTLTYDYIGLYGKVGYWDNPSKGVVSKNAKFGTLHVGGKAEIVLGGQYKSDRMEVILDTMYAENTGIIANKVVVSEDASITAANAQVGSFIAQGGTVKIHTGAYQGNTGMRLEGAVDSKQVQIHNLLKVVGDANVTIGTTTKDGSDKDGHVATAFGSFTYTGDPSIEEGDESTNVDDYVTNVTDYNIHSSHIVQEGGTLNVYGKSLSIGGLNIDQTGGSMSISTGINQAKDDKGNVTSEVPMCHFLADYGDSVITQNGDANTVLSIGLIKAYNHYYDNVVTSLKMNGKEVGDIDPKIDVTQSGAGTINLNGVYFFNQNDKHASTDVSSITQKDYVDEETGTVTAASGTINLNGNYEGATFNIDQSAANGTIKLNGSMSAGTVNQTAGELSISSTGAMTANSMSVGGTLTNNGTVQATGQVTATGTVDNNKNMAVQTLVINSGTTTNAKGATLTAGSITVNEGATLINHGTISSANGMMLLAEGDDIAAMNDATSNLITIAGGKMEQYGVTTDNILVQNGGTLTLGVVDGVTTPTSVGAVTLEKGANMKVEGNSTTGALTLNGGTITFTYGATLVSSSVEGMDKVEITVNLSDAALADIKAGNGFDMTLFTVKNETASSSALTGATVNFVSTSGGKAEATVKQDTEGKVTIGQLVPEPTTATLSLLALAALAARRRRAA